MSNLSVCRNRDFGSRSPSTSVPIETMQSVSIPSFRSLVPIAGANAIRPAQAVTCHRKYSSQGCMQHSVLYRACSILARLCQKIMFYFGMEALFLPLYRATQMIFVRKSVSVMVD